MCVRVRTVCVCVFLSDIHTCFSLTSISFSLADMAFCTYIIPAKFFFLSDGESATSHTVAFIALVLKSHITTNLLWFKKHDFCDTKAISARGCVCVNVCVLVCA